MFFCFPYFKSLKVSLDGLICIITDFSLCYYSDLFNYGFLVLELSLLYSSNSVIHFLPGAWTIGSGLNDLGERVGSSLRFLTEKLGKSYRIGKGLTSG